MHSHPVSIRCVGVCVCGCGVEPLTKFSKRHGLTGSLFLEGLAGKEEVTYIKNNLKSEIFNNKKFVNKNVFLCHN